MSSQNIIIKWMIAEISLCIWIENK